ncbi:hypothetical protein GIB67_040753, partial [Kingdonia uniflora]
SHLAYFSYYYSHCSLPSVRIPPLNQHYSLPSVRIPPLNHLKSICQISFPLL